MDTIRVYRREGDGFGPVFEFSVDAGAVLTTSLLPGLEIPLARVLKV